MSDFIADFNELTQDWISPEIFKLWSAITLVAGALERRVWTEFKPGPVYANLYTLLVAPPGVGKSVIDEVHRLWEATTKPDSKLPAFHVAPDSMTKAALMDTLNEAKSTYLTPTAAPYTYQTLLIPSEEFSVLVPSYDMEYIGALNRIWNNPDTHKERRRYGNNKDLVFQNPQINLLAGTQPSYMSSLFPEDAWNSGLARRLVMIYSAEDKIADIFGLPREDKILRQRVLRKLSQMSNLFGKVRWELEALEQFKSWHFAGGPPTPTHTKLVHYLRSRSVILIKLCLVSAVCQCVGEAPGEFPAIRVSDFERARTWLLHAETFMPDVFRAMIGRSDKDVIDELHHFATGEYIRLRGKGFINGMQLRRFLIERVPHDKVESIMLTADRAGIVVRVAPYEDDNWMPKPRQGIGGVE